MKIVLKNLKKQKISYTHIIQVPQVPLYTYLKSLKQHKLTLYKQKRSPDVKDIKRP